MSAEVRLTAKHMSSGGVSSAVYPVARKADIPFSCGVTIRWFMSSIAEPGNTR